MEESADDAFLRPQTANSAWSSSRRGSNSQYSMSPSRSMEGYSPYDASQYEDLAHPSFMIGEGDIPVEPTTTTSSESVPLSGFSQSSGRLLFPESDLSLSPSAWSPQRRPSASGTSRSSAGTGLQQSDPYTFATSQQSSQLLPSRSDSILESDTYRMLFGPYDDRLQNHRSSGSTTTLPSYSTSDGRAAMPPSPAAFRLPASSSSSAPSFAAQQTSSYPTFVDPTVLTSPGFSADMSGFNTRPSTTGSRSAAATRQRSSQTLGRTSRIASQPLPSSAISPFSSFSTTSNFDSPDIFGNTVSGSHTASFGHNHRSRSAHPPTQPTPLPLFPGHEYMGRRASVSRSSSHSDLSGAALQSRSSYGTPALPVRSARQPADPMLPPARRYGTATRANMRGLYTPESVDAAYPGEWGLAFR